MTEEITQLVTTVDPANASQPTEPTPANTPPSRGSRWPKGFSGNPTGRPKLKGEEREAMELARTYGKKAVRRLAQLMRSKNERVAVSAATALLDRGFGRPAQQITGANGAPLIPTSIFMGGGPIADAMTAAAAYAAIIRDPTIDLTQLAFAPPAPAQALILGNADGRLVADQIIEPVTPAPMVEAVEDHWPPMPPEPTAEEAQAEYIAGKKRDLENLARMRSVLQKC